MNSIKQGENKFYIGENEQEPIAQITYIPKADKLIVDHTFVADELRGQGIAKKLVEQVITYAENENKKIVPKCSYVEVFAKRYKEHQHMFCEE